MFLARGPEPGSTTSGDADRRACTACSPTLTAAVPPAACGRERGEGLTRIVPLEMLTEQQFAALRSELGSNRVAKAMALAGVTQVTLAKPLRLTQPYVSDVARGRYRTITVENAWKFAAYFGCRRSTRPALAAGYNGSSSAASPARSGSAASAWCRWPKPANRPLPTARPHARAATRWSPGAALRPCRRSKRRPAK